MRKRGMTSRLIMAVAFGVVLVYVGFNIAEAQQMAPKKQQVALEARPDTSGFEPLPEKPPIPVNNPMTLPKIELGKQLYFDPRLSINGTVACQSCHNVMSSGTSNLDVPVGVFGKLDGHRQDPTVWNAAFKTSQFWDGRAPSLEEQAKGPLFNPLEMGINPDTLVNRIKQIPGYVAQFEAVFGGKDSVTVDNIANAIASYERILITPNSPFDRFLKGDNAAISPGAQQGMALVRSIGCTACHNGPNLSGPSLEMGQGFFQKFPVYPDNKYVSEYNILDDLGRYSVTHKDGDQHMWIVQTWRNVELTAPYFHNGSVKDLHTAVSIMAKTQLDKDLSEAQVRSILDFLSTLTGEFPKQAIPQLPPTPGKTLPMQ